MARERLADIVAKDLRILLVAINPSPFSMAAGEHFATPGNPFWQLLHRAGLTPRRLRPVEARELLSAGIGLTTLVRRPTRMAEDLGRAEMRAGAAALERTVRRLRPRVVALLGLTLFPVVFPGIREPGPGPKLVTLSGATVFVLPNPSGRNRSYPGFAPKLRWYAELASLDTPRGASSPA
jgi:TDG/mug DNA glycosylase family protein